MKKEKFSLPEIEIILFSTEDIIRTSGGGQQNPDERAFDEPNNETPWSTL